MKKILAIFLALVFAFSMAACAGAPTPEPADQPSEAPVTEQKTEEPVASADGTYEIALVTDVGNIDDKSFNQGTWEGVKAYAEANGKTFNYYRPSEDSDEARIETIKTAIEKGAKVVACPGYLFASAVGTLQEQYPETMFLVLDVSLRDLPNPAANTALVTYQEEQAGYFAGYAAVKEGYTKLGFLGGMAVPAVIRYGYGFVQGCNDAGKEMNDEITVEYVYGNKFAGTPEITAYMDTWYQEKGVQVVFACGGGIYTSATEAAKKANGKVIGVDTDQAATINKLGTEGMTVTSAMKGLGATVKATLKDVIENGNWANYGGKIATLGLVSGDDPELNYVQIPMESTQWTDTFTKDDYKALVKSMFDGTVKVSDDTSAMPAHSIIVNEYDNIM